jgi:hypothetical protein
MTDANALFMAEFGSYFERVSAASPVGVCTKCLALRDRTEVDPQERCPVDLLRVGFDKVTSADQHEWKGFTSRAELEEYIKLNIPRYKELVEKAAEFVVLAPAEEEPAAS